MSGRMAGTENLLDSCEDKIDSHFFNYQQLRKSNLSSLLLGVERADGAQFGSKHSSLTFLQRFSLIPIFLPRNLNFRNTTKSLKINGFAQFSFSKCGSKRPQPFQKRQAVSLFNPVKFHFTTPSIR